MKWVKAPDELKILPEEVMKGFECEKRLMFGYPAFFINSNMFAGLFQDQLFVGCRIYFYLEIFFPKAKYAFYSVFYNFHQSKRHAPSIQPVKRREVRAQMAADEHHAPPFPQRCIESRRSWPR